ncbi:MAG: hypothetical protein H7X86_04225 [Gorillibacterium sp.]|nr:hypothetical protein [Gorillibacterium sp.]
MKWLTRFIVVTGMSIAIAGVLSVLPRIDLNNSRQEASVQGKVSHNLLTSENLVDRLVQLDLYLDIQHVSWDPPILSIDFGSPAAVDTNAVYRDLYDLSRFSMERTLNVEELQVRVYAAKLKGSAGSHPLLLSLNARREDAVRFTRPQSNDAEGYKQFLENSCRLAFTQKWRDMLSQD